nr:TonB-dependent siderophore receptor [Amaricoccus macauensis]
MLQPINVEAEADGATEGTGTFAAPQATSATGLPLTLRETPQSVSVVTEQRIEDQNLGTVLDVLSYTTGVNAYGSETDRDSTYSRGFWVSNYLVDGMNIPTYQGWFSGVSMQSSTATVDRVEVLRGATGLLTGTGEPGAAVAITRKRASSPVFGGTAALRYGNWNRIGGTLDVSTPLNADGSVRSRFIMDAASEESYVDRYSVKKQTYYGTVEADLTDATRLTFSLEHRNHDPRASTWGGLPLMFASGEPTHFPRSFSNAPDWSHWSSYQSSAMVRLDHRFDNGWSGNLILSGVDRKYDAELLYMHGDLDQATGLGLIPGAWKGSDHDRLVAFDANLTGPVSLFGREHTLNFSLHADRDWMKRDWPEEETTPAPIGNIFVWTGAYPKPAWGTAEADFEENRTKFSALASGRFNLTDDLHLVLGGRQTSWKGNMVFEYGEGFREFDKFTPFAGVVYDATDDWSLYASYTEVFNPQDYQDRNGNFLDPVIGRSREVGAKGEIFEGRMNASFALFRSYLDNVAEQDGNHMVPGTINHAYRGAKGVKAEGGEFEFSGEITPGWSVYVGGQAMSLKAADGGEFAPDQPRNTLKVFTAYTLPGAWSKWTLGGGLRWQSKTWVDVTNGNDETHRFTQPSYTVVDAMARYDFDERWSAQLNVNNLFDKTYYQQALDQSFYGEPLNAMLSVSASF